MSSEGTPDWPRRGEYPDPHEYAEVRDEKLRNYIDLRNRHRQVALDMLSTTVATHEHDLGKKGWVQAVADDVEELKTTFKGMRTMLITTMTSVILMLLALVLNLIRGGAL